MLYETEVPGVYAAEWGGLTVQVDTLARKVSLFAWLDGASDEDFGQAEAELSALGVVGFTEVAEIEDGLTVSEAAF